MKVVSCDPADRSEDISDLKEKALKTVEIPKDYFTDAKYTKFLEDKADFFLGIKDGEIIATGGYKRPEGQIVERAEQQQDLVEFKNMHVHPEHRRKGFGQQIMDRLLEEAVENGYAEAVLETTDAQKAACSFYETNGFRKVNERPITDYSREFKVVMYEKNISEIKT